MTKNCFVGYITTNMSLLPIARNIAIQAAYENNPNFTHIFFLDDDMCNYDDRHVAALWRADKPIISALMTMRKPPYQICSKFVSDFNDESFNKAIQNSEVIEAIHTGMAFTLIKREVLDSLREETPEGPIWFTSDRSKRGTYLSESEEFISKYQNRLTELFEKDKAFSIHDFLHTAMFEAIIFGSKLHENTIALGEDVSFCQRAKAFTFPTFVHCGAYIGHVGRQVCDITSNAKSASNNTSPDKCDLRLVGAS